MRRSKTLFFTLLALIVYNTSINAQQRTTYPSSLDSNQIFKVGKLYMYPEAKGNYLTSITFSEDGNLLFKFDNKYVLWSSDTKSLGAVKCLFDSKEGLLMLNKKQEIVWRKTPTLTKANERYILNLQGRITISKIVTHNINSDSSWDEFDGNPTIIASPNFSPDIEINNFEKCGCKGLGKAVYLVNNFPYHWKVKIRHKYQVSPTYEYETYKLQPNQRMKIGCTRHFCTEIAPNGYSEELSIYEYQCEEIPWMYLIWTK